MNKYIFVIIVIILLISLYFIDTCYTYKKSNCNVKHSAIITEYLNQPDSNEKVNNSKIKDKKEESGIILKCKDNNDYNITNYKNIEGISDIEISDCNVSPTIKDYIKEEFTQNSITFNKLYYGLPCKYQKNDAFYTALKEERFNETTDIKQASLIVPCSYETTEKEIVELKDNKIQENKYGKNVRIYMLNNTDYMVSKLMLWKYLKDTYGVKIASRMTPYAYDLTDDKQIEEFKKNYDSKKIYITKNNNQRQEGLKIHTTLSSILDSRKDYILVQELLQNPYTIDGRKINLRVYCLFIRDTYGNVKIQIYQDGFMYYTPEKFVKGNPSFAKNITTGYIDRQVYIDNPLTHQDFKKYLDNPERKLNDVEIYIKNNYPNVKLSSYVFSQINHLLKYVLKAYVNTIGTKTDGVSFQLYGADIAISDDLRPMIMEVNKGPDLSAKDGRDKELKVNMCKDILKSVNLITDDGKNKFLTVSEITKINDKYVDVDNYSEM